MIVRILVFIGGLRALVEGDRITDPWLLCYLGLEAISQSPEPRAAIQHALEPLLQTLEKKPSLPPKAVTLTRNLDELSRALDLSPVEQDILLFVTACHYSRELNRVLQQLRDIRLPEAFHVVACATGNSFVAISKALAPGAKLVSSGLLQVDGQMAMGFEHQIQLLPGLADQLNIPHQDPADLFFSSFRRATSPTLTLEDFRHLGVDLEVLGAYLMKIREAHQRGVNVLLHGPVGTGKSQLARVIALYLRAPLYEIACQDRYGNTLSGEGRLSAYQLAQGVLGGDPQPVILFDEVEDVFAEAPTLSFMDNQRRRRGGRKALINQSLEQNRTPAIWITNHVGVLDPAFARRFDMVLEIKAPPRSTRARILDHYLQGTVASDAVKQRLADHADLAPAIVERAAKVIKAVQTNLTPEATGEVLQRIIGNSLEAMGLPRQSRSQGNTPHDYRLSMVNTDRDLVALTQGIRRTGRASMCLYGAPGTGKSGYGGHLARELDRPLHLHRASDLLNSLVGETEANIARMFHDAEEAGAVLLLDEADTFLRNRAGAQHSWEATMTNEMLAQMEVYDGVFVATTNLLDELDPAVLRRFAVKVGFKAMTQAQRVEMGLSCWAMLGLEATKESLDALIHLEGLTPGDYATVLRQSELQPIPDAATFISLLRSELALKPEGRRRTVGF